MKNLPYIRYILILISYAILWVPNLVFHLLFFWIGMFNWIRNKKIPFLIWFLNIDEPTQVENNYGDDEHRAEWGITDILNRNIFVRFKWYMKWNIRNPYFYYQQYVVNPLKVTSTVIKVKKNTANKDNLHICGIKDRGVIHIIEERTKDGKTKKYFRYSFTKVIFNKWLWNVQMGVTGIENNGSNRYLIDGKIEKIN